MRAFAALALAAALPLFAPKPATHPAKAPPPSPPSPPPASLAVARVEITFRSTTALVTTELTFEPPPGPRDVFVAYGSPGLPTAFAAELLAVPEGRFSPARDATGALLVTAHAVRAPSDAWASLGPARSAGSVVHVDARSLAALPATTLVALRLRAVHALADRDAHPRSVVARVSRDGAPLPLGEVTVRAEAATPRDAAATLCTPPGDEVGLALGPGVPAKGLSSPMRARRTDGQELCVRARLQ